MEINNDIVDKNIWCLLTMLAIRESNGNILQSSKFKEVLKIFTGSYYIYCVLKPVYLFIHCNFLFPLSFLLANKFQKFQKARLCFKHNPNRLLTSDLAPVLKSCDVNGHRKPEEEAFKGWPRWINASAYNAIQYFMVVEKCVSEFGLNSAWIVWILKQVSTKTKNIIPIVIIRELFVQWQIRFRKFICLFIPLHRSSFWFLNHVPGLVSFLFI